jgi:hypothetical protein
MFTILSFMIACSGGNSPKGVARNFLKAYSKMDYEEAKKYGTEDTRKLLDMLNAFSRLAPDSTMIIETKTEIISENIHNDSTATVTYKEEGTEEMKMLNLIKTDGKWKISMDKGNLNGDESIDSGATSTDTTQSQNTSRTDSLIQ